MVRTGEQQLAMFDLYSDYRLCVNQVTIPGEAGAYVPVTIEIVDQKNPLSKNTEFFLQRLVILEQPIDTDW